MNISIDQIKALRATIELGAKGVTSLPLEEIAPALREVIEQGAREINSLVNVLILLENPGIAKELDDLTEQCGVNTSSTFNTPPPEPPGELDPEVWKCNEPKADTPMPDPKREEMAQVVLTHIVPMLDQLEEDEDEPREPNPVEKLIDTVKMVFECYPHLRNRLPIAMLTYAEEAQDFLDGDTCLRERVKELEKHIEGLEETAKRYRPDLDVLDEFPKLHFKNVHVIRQLLWELGVGRENKTD